MSERLSEYVLGLLPEAEARALEAELARSPALAEEVRAIEDALAAVALSLPPIVPAAGARARLLAAALEDRFAPFADRFARFFDLARARAVEILCAIGRSTAGWREAGIEGVTLFDFDPGPAFAGADAGLVQLRAGARFPMHTHIGEERVMVLQGGLDDLTDGSHLRPGDTSIKPPGSSHAYAAGPGEDLIQAVLLFGGIDVLGYGTAGLKKR